MFCSMEEMGDFDDIEKIVGKSIPVASGDMWSRRDASRAKNADNKRKAELVEASRVNRSLSKKRKERSQDMSSGNRRR